MTRYKVILFDADGTLFDFKKAEAVAFEHAMRQYGIKDYKKEYHLKHYHLVNSAIWEEFEEGLISAKKLKTERFRRYFNIIKKDWSAEDFAITYRDFLAQASFLYDGVIELLEGLCKKYKLVLLTNGFTKVQRGRLSLSPIQGYFDSVIISEEVEMAKPDPAIFEYALNSINHKNKKDVLIVGDGLNSDITGGINFGIDTCWYNRSGSNEIGSVEPTYIIESLTDLNRFIL